MERPSGSTVLGSLRRNRAIRWRATHLITATGIFASIALLLPAAFTQEVSSSIRFSDRADRWGLSFRSTNGNPERRYIIETLGSGGALFDYDGDADLDLYLANGSSLEGFSTGREPLGALYRNEGGSRFTDVTKGSGLAEPFWGFGTAAGDYDNDGDPDLYVTAFGPDRLFRNNGDGTFTDAAPWAGVDDGRFGASAAFLDYDHDGALDLYVTHYVTFDPEKIPSKEDPNSPCTFRGLTVMCGPHGLPGADDALYHNNGDGTFTDVARAAGLWAEGEYYGLGVTTTDVNGDGWTDILVANDSTPNQLFMNRGDGSFTDEALMAGFAYSNDGRAQAGMGIDTGDIDGDGDMDVFITNFSHDYSTLRLNDGKGFLEDISIRVGLAQPTMLTLGWGTVMFDMENDGDLDLFLANGHVYPEVEKADIGTRYRQRNQFFENRGNLAFKEIIPSPGGETGDDRFREDLHRGTVPGDLDGDGDVDLVVTVLDGRPELLINESRPGSWLQVRLVGRASVRDGVGARVTVTAQGRRWVAERRGGGSYLSAPDPRLLFGLGSAARVDSLEVQWPSGSHQVVPSPPMNQVVTVLEPGPA